MNKYYILLKILSQIEPFKIGNYFLYVRQIRSHNILNNMQISSYDLPNKTFFHIYKSNFITIRLPFRILYPSQYSCT